MLMTRSNTPYLKGMLLAVFLVCFARGVPAHPWGGLVIDATGDIYFTFICPFTSDDHYACVWKLSDGKITPSLESASSPSDIILARNNSFTRIDLMAWGPDETLYIHDRGTLCTLEPATGAITLIASNLREESPEHLPFSGANILFDMAANGGSYGAGPSLCRVYAKSVAMAA